MKASDVKRALKKIATKERKEAAEWFFKTGVGEYGHGDVFAGVSVPDVRKVAKQARDMNMTELRKLFTSKIHEERLCAHVILIHKFETGDQEVRHAAYNFYLSNTKHINNWDLVDTSAHKIVGANLYTQPRAVAKKTLQTLALSSNLWERRISIIATAYFINQNRFGETLGIAQMLRNDSHDLIHKAVGWMLREVGKRNLEVEERFLRKYYKDMPRTMLRYAIEKFPEKKRQQYLKGTI